MFYPWYSTESLLPQGRREEAAAILGEFLKSAVPVFPAEHTNMVIFRSHYSRVLVELGRYQEAEPVVRDLLAARERVGPPDDYRIHISRGALGEVVGKLGRPQEAEPLLLGAFEALDTRHPTQREHRSRALERLIGFYEDIGRENDAAAFRAKRVEPAPPPG
jgi:hypothetical protein